MVVLYMSCGLCICCDWYSNSAYTWKGDLPVGGRGAPVRRTLAWWNACTASGKRLRPRSATPFRQCALAQAALTATAEHASCAHLASLAFLREQAGWALPGASAVRSGAERKCFPYHAGSGGAGDVEAPAALRGSAARQHKPGSDCRAPCRRSCCWNPGIVLLYTCRTLRVLGSVEQSSAVAQIAVHVQSR